MNIKLPSVPKPVLKLVGRPTLLAQAKSPEILLAAGVVGVVTSAVLACRATLKLDEVLQDAEKTRDAIEIMDRPDYSATDKTKDLALVKVQTAQKIARMYILPVGLGVVSIGALVGSHRILSTRNAGLAAAYTALDKGFQQYRDRVLQEVGVEKERELRYGKEFDVVTDEQGRTQLELKPGTSIYARFFDQFSRNWQRGEGYNQLFLQCQQNYANDLLRARGHVFLNEVYDMLGLERTKEGAVVGWVKGNGDNYIDFGVFEGDQWSAMRFVTGDEDSILLDFNVDGVIYDLI